MINLSNNPKNPSMKNFFFDGLASLARLLSLVCSSIEPKFEDLIWHVPTSYGTGCSPRLAACVLYGPNGLRRRGESNQQWCENPRRKHPFGNLKVEKISQLAPLAARVSPTRNQQLLGEYILAPLEFSIQKKFGLRPMLLSILYPLSCCPDLK